LENTDIKSIKLDGEIVAIDKNTLSPLPFGDLLKQKKFKSTNSLEED
jgi:ATP-dependent DNA ligase